ncbi:hypothetical protein PP707_08010, partial [Acetobacter pasteurianus]|nr:hypothetical protein [Acetobacter pasteurianus]
MPQIVYSTEESRLFLQLFLISSNNNKTFADMLTLSKWTGVSFIKNRLGRSNSLNDGQTRPTSTTPIPPIPQPPQPQPSMIINSLQNKTHNNRTKTRSSTSNNNATSNSTTTIVNTSTLGKAPPIVKSNSTTALLKRRKNTFRQSHHSHRRDTDPASILLSSSSSPPSPSSQTPPRSLSSSSSKGRKLSFKKKGKHTSNRLSINRAQILQSVPTQDQLRKGARPSMEIPSSLFLNASTELTSPPKSPKSFSPASVHSTEYFAEIEDKLNSQFNNYTISTSLPSSFEKPRHASILSPTDYLTIDINKDQESVYNFEGINEDDDVNEEEEEEEE